MPKEVNSLFIGLFIGLMVYFFKSVANSKMKLSLFVVIALEMSNMEVCLRKSKSPFFHNGPL